jgi:tRNA(Ile)-lysidine synthase TilS/MesJ
VFRHGMNSSGCCSAPSLPSDEVEQTIRPTIDWKIDLFMRLFVLPTFDPAQICWWLSLSGGKDSFVMAHALRDWYSRAGVQFRAEGFVINQWGGAAVTQAARSFDWLPVRIIDARTATSFRTEYQLGQQAPCRSCSDVRHNFTDALLDQAPVEWDRIHFIARGLHLSDMAVSLVWRLFQGLDPSQEMLRAGKGRPIAQLANNRFLVKPLAFVREFETQNYANEIGFHQACCGCPACRYPSRRDIVEETLLHFFRSDLWEFDVPGIDEFLQGHKADIDVSELRKNSKAGLASKHNHLPDDFAEFALDDAMRSLSIAGLSSVKGVIDFDSCLDDYGLAALAGDEHPTPGDKIPAPAILTRADVSEATKMAIAALGPFWAAFRLAKERRQIALQLQQTLFGICVDEKLSNVHTTLRKYYGEI